ncbi:RNA polymerase subunit sigma-70 [Tsukamurella soli]|uniref:Sigma factor-like helix-turn-helix DNA-binding protein n=1 Tax=Tsukamurella soli TaxID=644556 RepID=A0ABP8JXL2_9ACTN
MSSPHTLIDSAASEDPAQGLRAVVALRRLADQLEAVQVANARRLGWSWQDIARHLDVTRQAVHKKYGK